MISIICPVHNDLEYTKRCLVSLSIAVENSTYKDNIDIIFVDDGSTDGTAEWINENYPKVKVLKGDGNLWWSGAMNVGAKYALENGAQYIFIINNDNLFEKDCIDKLIHFTKDKNVKIVGSKVMNLETNQVCWSGGYFNSKTGAFGAYKSTENRVESYFKVDWLPGMGTLIHHSVFEKIGYWNEKDFPQYYGDTDFTLRAKENGIDAYVYTESIIWNDLEKTGFIHNGGIFQLMRSLYSIKSHYNIFKSIKFSKKHCNNTKGCLKFLFNMYGGYIGGYFIHDILKIKRTA